MEKEKLIFKATKEELENVLRKMKDQNEDLFCVEFVEKWDGFIISYEKAEPLKGYEERTDEAFKRLSRRVNEFYLSNEKGFLSDRNTADLFSYRIKKALENFEKASKEEKRHILKLKQ